MLQFRAKVSAVDILEKKKDCSGSVGIMYLSDNPKVFLLFA